MRRVGASSRSSPIRGCALGDPARLHNRQKLDRAELGPDLPVEIVRVPKRPRVRFRPFGLFPPPRRDGGGSPPAKLGCLAGIGIEAGIAPHVAWVAHGLPAIRATPEVRLGPPHHSGHAQSSMPFDRRAGHLQARHRRARTINRKPGTPYRIPEPTGRGHASDRYPHTELWRLVREVALGGIHPIRRSVIEYLASEDCPHVASTIAARCHLRETTVRRHLDDLAALRVLDVVGTNPRVWQLSALTRFRWLGEIWTSDPLSSDSAGQ
jgi:hypothetical protein